MEWRCQVDRQGKSTRQKQLPGRDTHNLENIGPYFQRLWKKSSLEREVGKFSE